VETKLVTLLRLLQQQTNVGKVKWEYVDADDMIRASVGDGIVRIGWVEGEDYDPHNPDGPLIRSGELHLEVWLVDGRGRIVEQFPLASTTHEYELAKDLFEPIKQNFKRNRTEQALDSMIRSLSKSA
jgi:hypothetical protein